MYRHVPPYTVIDTEKYVLVRTFGNLSIPVRTGTHQYVPACTIFQRYVPVCTIEEYVQVHAGTYRYVLP
jgi:hypothetical protein